MSPLPIAHHRRIFYSRLDPERWLIVPGSLAAALAIGLVLVLLAFQAVAHRPRTPECRVYDPGRRIGILVDERGREVFCKRAAQPH